MKKTFVGLILLLFSGVLFAQANEMNPEAAKFYNEGNSLMKSGNYQGAIDSYNKAISIEKDHRSFYQLGVAYRKSNNLPEAEKAFKSSIQLNSNFDIAYNGLGGTYFSMKNYSAAIENFKKLEELSKSNDIKNKAKDNISRSYTLLGKENLSDGKTNDAIANLLKAVEYSPYDAAFLTLAEFYSSVGNYDKAIEAADKALNSRKTISKGGPYYYKGIAFKKKGDKEKAIENFKLGLADPQYRSVCQYELDTLK